MGQVEVKLEDKYHVQKVKLGEGSFGVVRRAVDRSTQDAVAVKQLDKGRMLRRGVSREHIEREIRIMTSCRHINVLGLFAAFEDENAVHLVLEYCDGGDFGDKVNERGQNLREDEAVKWMHDILSGVNALHSKGICHRDVKPENFMVQGVVGSLCIKLADFGLAAFLPPSGQLLTHKCGTLPFMAPEVHLLPTSSFGYGLPCDVWAVGVVLSMLTHGGQHPFKDSAGKLVMDRLLSGVAVSDGLFSGLMQQGPKFSDDARQLRSRMLDTNPGNRPSAEDALRSQWFSARCLRPGLQLPAGPPAPVRKPPAAPSAVGAVARQGPTPCRSLAQPHIRF